MNRRRFLEVASIGLVAACRDPLVPEESSPRLLARREPPFVPGIPEGFSRLTFGGTGLARNGRVYVPQGYSATAGAPLLVLLHGAGQSSALWETPELAALADQHGIVVLAPDSRKSTWDLAYYGVYRDDPAFIDAALRWTFERLNVLPDRISLGGFSDGASYALSLGLANGDFFNGLVAFSPGFLDNRNIRGQPRAFVSHGRSDPVLAFRGTDEGVVPYLTSLGMDVEYVPFDGGHEIPDEVGDAAFAWLGE